MDRIWSACVGVLDIGPDRAFRHNAPGFCPAYEDWIESALDVHMTNVNVHLEMAQLWKVSVGACQEHLSEKHGGSSLFDMKNVIKFFPHGLFPATSGKRLFGPMFWVLLWTLASSMRPVVDWYTVTGCIRTHSHTRHSGMVSSLASCPVRAGPWPSPGSLTCGSLFRRRERHLAMSQQTVFRRVLLDGTGRVLFE